MFRVTLNVLLIKKNCWIQLCIRFQLSIADHRLERNSEAFKWVYNAHINSHFLNSSAYRSQIINQDIMQTMDFLTGFVIHLDYLWMIFISYSSIFVKKRIANTYVRNVHPSSIIPSFSYGYWLLIQSCVETDRTKINSPRLSTGWNIKQPKKSYELHEIIMLMSDSSSQRRRFGWVFFISNILMYINNKFISQFSYFLRSMY